MTDTGSCRGDVTEVCLVGPFPPPVFGPPLMNERVERGLREQGVRPMTIDTSPRAFRNATLLRGLSRLPIVVRGLSRLVKFGHRRRGAAVYISIAGGYGQLADSLYTICARVVGLRLYLNHHSYHYLQRWRWPMALLSGLAGRNATHVVLCDDMERRLLTLYRGPRRTRVLSSVGPMGILEPGVLRDSLTTIGFLGNISKAKGIIEFLRVAEELERSGYNVRSLLAGPLWEESARPVLEDGLRRLKNLEYRGPRYGPEKAIFYKEVDVFLFPSRYRHEAEPAVIHEAMASGAPVIAWDRGCIAGMEPNLLIPMAEDFVQTSVRQLKEWLDSPATFGAASRQAAATSEVAKVRGGEQFAALLGELMGCTPMVT